MITHKLGVVANLMGKSDSLVGSLAAACGQYGFPPTDDLN